MLKCTYINSLFISSTDIPADAILVSVFMLNPDLLHMLGNHFIFFKLMPYCWFDPFTICITLSLSSVFYLWCYLCFLVFCHSYPVFQKHFLNTVWPKKQTLLACIDDGSVQPLCKAFSSTPQRLESLVVNPRVQKTMPYAPKNLFPNLIVSTLSKAALLNSHCLKP